MSKAKASSQVSPSTAKIRFTAYILFGFGVAQILSVQFDFVLWKCPFREGLGIPCPGCGLTRATVALLHGDWATAMSIHAFAPFAVAALAVLGCLLVLPERLGTQIVERFLETDRRVRFSAALLIGLLLYWMVRIPEGIAK